MLSHTPQQNTVEPMPAARKREDRGDAGMPPCNTIPAYPITNILRYGIDSLYVSYEGELYDNIAQKMGVLKELAQSKDDTAHSAAQFKVGDHIFEVASHGTRGYSYILSDNAFRIQANYGGEESRFIYCQISSAYLASVTPREAIDALKSVIDELGERVGEAKVSRVDLHVDFTTDYAMANFQQEERLVCKSKKYALYRDSPGFTGFNLGLGGNIALRLYDKIFETEKRSKKKKPPQPYLKDLWKQNGWVEGQQVWRVEFEIKRSGLFPLGIGSVDELLSRLNSLWEHLTTKWCRYTDPNLNDLDHRERWPNAAIWEQVIKAFGGDAKNPLTPTFSLSRVPSDKYFSKNTWAGMTSFMAAKDYDELEEAFPALIELAEVEHERASKGNDTFRAYIARKVSEKRRRYNTLLNNPHLFECNAASHMLSGGFDDIPF